MLSQKSSNLGQALPDASEGDDEDFFHQDTVVQMPRIIRNKGPPSNCGGELTPPDTADQAMILGTDVMIVDDNDINRR